MRVIAQRVDDLVIVDPNLEDYDAVLAELDAQDWRVSLAASGDAAMRAAYASPSAVWLVNAQLPDMAGVCLLSLVRRRLRRATVFLVGDEYSPVDELAARSAGATAYVCKPPSISWLEQCLQRCRSPGIRAGPRCA